MSFDDDRLRQILDKNDGYCRLCGKQLSLGNHGAKVGRGRWQVDHSIPVSRGGTDHLNNLWPMCSDCNQKKADMTWRQARKRFGSS